MGDEKLISKKELLERFGMSYGALYRWKRKGLIPEEWFIKKSTTTGQETFFPEALITRRVEEILKSKSEVELDELARRFQGEEQTAATLILSTPYGEKSFPAADVQRIAIVKGGRTVDLTGVILNLLKED